MKAQTLGAMAIIFATATIAYATNVQLTLTSSDPADTTGTWQVTATLSDNQTLGIAAFSIDVVGVPDSSGTIAIQQAATVSQTLQVSNPPYSQSLSTGTVSGSSLLGIAASQDLVTAANNYDPEILRFGDGLASPATSPVYDVVPPGGPLVLARGRWVTRGYGGSLYAQVTPASGFSLFPLNYAVDDGSGNLIPPPPGTVQNAISAGVVSSSAKIHVGDDLLPAEGDVNLDGRIDAADIVAIENALADLSAYQMANGLSNAQLLAVADPDGDGQVTNADIQALISLMASFGGSGALTAVPEPATWLLAAIAFVFGPVGVAAKRSRASASPSATCNTRPPAEWGANEAITVHPQFLARLHGSFGRDFCHATRGSPAKGTARASMTWEPSAATPARPMQSTRPVE